MVRLRGIAWDHARGYDPMLSTAAAYQQEHADVQIVWERRSLHDFGAMPVDRLARDYDLVVLDHPWVGFMAETRCYVPMDLLVPQAALDALRGRSVGPSHHSYAYGGHQWALAIDAATPVAAYRSDLLQRLGLGVPRTWSEVIDLARAAAHQGLAVAAPLGAVDAITMFLSLAVNLGARPFDDGGRVVPREAGRAVIAAMQDLVRVADPACRKLTPITVLDRLCGGEQLVYCPLAYGYSNYGREGFRRHRCRFADMPSLGGHGPRGSHLGGTGIAVSARCRHQERAADYCLRVAGGDWQRSIYFDAGGQPAHTAAWDDPEVDRRANCFFSDTRRTIESAYVRPRYAGYIHFQYTAGEMIGVCLDLDGDVDALLDDLDELYARTLRRD